jgi:hypothetical protein
MPTFHNSQHLTNQPQSAAQSSLKTQASWSNSAANNGAAIPMQNPLVAAHEASPGPRLWNNTSSPCNSF